MITIGSLFSGIGGLELGLEWAGLGPVLWQVEMDAYRRSVLAKVWPNADRSVRDVREADAQTLKPVGLVCGGFPCRDVSPAGKRRGIHGAESGLWFEMRRCVASLRPEWVVIENSTGLTTRGMGEVVAGLCEDGYDTLWFPLRAADVGLPHGRSRVFIVAHTDAFRRQAEPAARLHAHGPCWDDAYRCRDAPPRRGDARAWSAYVDSGNPKPGVRRSADGSLPRLYQSRLAALGDMVVPTMAEAVGWVIRGLAQQASG